MCIEALQPLTYANNDYSIINARITKRFVRFKPVKYRTVSALACSQTIVTGKLILVGKTRFPRNAFPIPV